MFSDLLLLAIFLFSELSKTSRLMVREIAITTNKIRIPWHSSQDTSRKFFFFETPCNNSTLRDKSIKMIIRIKTPKIIKMMHLYLNKSCIGPHKINLFASLIVDVSRSAVLFSREILARWHPDSYEKLYISGFNKNIIKSKILIKLKTIWSWCN